MLVTLGVHAEAIPTCYSSATAKLGWIQGAICSALRVSFRSEGGTRWQSFRIKVSAADILHLARRLAQVLIIINFNILNVNKVAGFQV